MLNLILHCSPNLFSVSAWPLGNLYNWLIVFIKCFCNVSSRVTFRVLCKKKKKKKKNNNSKFTITSVLKLYDD